MQHGDVGKQMMCQQHRLGALQMGVAGHREVGVRGRRLGQGIGQTEHAAHKSEESPLRPEPQVGRDLIVAGATGMEFAGDRADHLAQPPLDASVDVLIDDGEREIAVVDFGENLPESALERRGVFSGDDSLFAKHAGVGDRPANVLPDQAHVERDRGVERLEATVGRLSEPPAPCLHCSGPLSHAHLLAERRCGLQSALLRRVDTPGIGGEGARIALARDDTGYHPPLQIEGRGEEQRQ